MKSFDEVFGAAPAITAEAPGRVNLLGEHTDYNDGYVMPTAIPQTTRVGVGKSAAPEFTLYAAELDRTSQFTISAAPAEHFATYVYGCIRELDDYGVPVPALNIHVSSRVPIGVGLSSSAALEIATLRALRAYLGKPLDDVLMARLAQQAEIKYAGVHCGIMDQMASSLADTRSMLFLDTRSLSRALLPLPEETEILVVDSGVARSLASSKYNERRAQCEQAARLLGLKSLRDVSDAGAIEQLAEPLRRRVRHVLSENQRVLRARQDVSPAEFGRLMNASHRSLRDNFEVSIAELDLLAGLLQNHSLVYGARLTGAGFGGACVALCRAGSAPEVSGEVVGKYNRDGREGRVLVPPNFD